MSCRHNHQTFTKPFINRLHNSVKQPVRIVKKSIYHLVARTNACIMSLPNEINVLMQSGEIVSGATGGEFGINDHNCAPIVRLQLLGADSAPSTLRRR